MALAAGQTITAAARSAGVHRATVHNWLSTDPAFRAEFDRIRHDLAWEMRDRLIELERLALEELQKILTDPAASPSVKLRAAMFILNRRPSPPAPESAVQPDEIRHNSTPRHDPPVESATTPPRNSACPCGSGQKYKRCCGRNAPPHISAAA
jgi:hypothetical protein